MRQTTKGNQWFIGLKAHIGVDTGIGCTHTVSVTAADVHDLDQAATLAYAARGFQGAHHRLEIAGDAELMKIEFLIAARKGRLAEMACPRT